MKNETSKKFRGGGKRRLVWITSSILLFFSVVLMGFAYSYFTSLGNQQKSLDFAVISLGFGNSTAVTVKQNSVTIGSNAVVPGCDIVVNGRVNNTGSCGIYAVIGVNVSFTGYEDVVYYNLSGTKLVLNNNDEFSTASTYIASSSYADFSNVSYILDENIGDEAQGEEILVTVTAYGIQSNYIPTESPAVKATNLMVNPYFQKRTATIVVGNETITITDNVKSISEFVSQTSYTEENSCGWFTDAECTQVADLNSGYDPNSTLYTKSATITLDNTTNNNITISGDEVSVTSIGNSTATDVVIPASVAIGGETYTVTSVADDAFKNNTTITSVTLPSTIETIGDSAFQGCTKLKTVSIPETVTQIGARAFASSGIQEVDWENMTDDEIQQSLFSSCTGLKSITIPDSVESIGQYAFYACHHLATINWSSVGGLTTIGANAFQLCVGLQSISIPEGITSIGSYAFAQCNGATSIYIPASLTSIGSHAFLNNADSVTSIVVNENNPVYDSRNNCNAIIHTSTNKLIKGCRTTIIPSTVVTLGSYSFSGTRITTLEISEGVQVLEGSLYGGNNKQHLTTVILPSTIISTADASGCFDAPNLVNVTIKNKWCYDRAINSYNLGKLIAYATTIKVLASVDDGSNTYLNNNFTKTTDGDYSVYTKN